MERTQKRVARKPEVIGFGNVRVRIYSRIRRTTTGGLRTVYEVADYSSGIRRFRGFTAQDAARAEAKRIARQISSGDAQAAGMNNSEAASYGRAVELLRSTGTALEIAAGVYAKAFKILGGDSIVEAATLYARHRADQVERKRVAEVVAELIALKESRGKSKRYIEDLRARLSRFAEAFAVDISTVTTSDVQGFLDRLKVSPQTEKNFRTVLGTLFSFAESRGYILKNSSPVDGTEKVSAHGGAIEIYTPEEIASLLRAASSEFLPIVALGAFAGLRAAETQRIEWRDIDVAGKFIHVGGDKSKTRSRRLVPIVPNLAAWLAPYSKRDGKVWPGSSGELRRERSACVEDAGVAWKDNGLRHSFISYRLAEVQNAAQVSLEAGNSPGVVFKHYRELVKPAHAKKWFGVEPDSHEDIVAIRI